MLIYLLRHAIAEVRAATDSDRNLTPEGVVQANSVADKFRQYSPVIDKAFCSPYNRAQQTAAAAMAVFPELSLDTEERITPGGDVFGVLNWVEELGVEHLLLIGHNPLLSRLLSLMVDGTMESYRHVDNATLYCLSMDVVAPGCGEIVYTLEP